MANSWNVGRAYHPLGKAIGSGVKKLTIEEIVADLTKDLATIYRVSAIVAEKIKVNGLNEAKQITEKDLPSGGGSYLASLTAGILHEDGHPKVSIYSRHKWARAVENGTGRHPIEAKSSKINKARGVKPFAERAYHGTRFGNTILREGLKASKSSPEARHRGLEKLAKHYGHSLDSAKKHFPGFEGMYDFYTAVGEQTWAPYVFGARERYVSERYAANPPEYISYTEMVIREPAIMEAYKTKKKVPNHYGENLGKPMILEARLPKGYYGSPEFMKLMAESGKDKNTYYENNFPLGKKVSPKDIRVAPTPLAIRDMLPVRGGGQKNPNSPPLGTKWSDKGMVATIVDHPGARPFKIFERTQKFIDENLMEWIKEAFSEAM